MRQFFFITGFCLGVLSVLSVNAQDFYGANFTGKHTWGVSAKWDGNFWVGTHYNVRRFGAFGSRPLDVNLGVEIKIDKGISTLAGDLGFGQVYADGNDFKSSFGLGARYGLRAEYCPIQYKDDDEKPSCVSLSAKLAVKPGYYTNSYSISANVETDLVKFYWGCNNIGYKKEGDSGKNMDVRIGETLTVGARADWTNVINGGGRYHLTADVGNSFYLGVKHRPAWDTWHVKGDYPKVEENEGSCLMPDRNILLKASHSIRF